MGPRSVDAIQEERVTERTRETYRVHAARFTRWALEMELHPATAEDWDDLLVEYKHSHEKLTRSEFAYTTAAVEFFFPRLRGELRWTHSLLSGWTIHHATKHTVPLGKGPAKLIAIHWGSAGEPRAAVGVVLQACTGLRPMELLKLKPEDIVMPEEMGGTLENTPMIIALGLKTGTKVKRAQTVRVTQANADVVEAVRRVRAATPLGHLMFPMSNSTYRLRLQEIEKVFDMKVGWTPHSPRAGFASDARVAGWAFEEIREAGRWQADSSLRTYLDVVSAASTVVALRARGLGDALAWAHGHWLSYV